MAVDKVRKSRASYENIYHSATIWLQSLLELICVFLRGAAVLCRMGDTPQLRTGRAAALIHDLLEPEAENRLRGRERVPRRGGSPQILLREEQKCCKSNAHEPVPTVPDSRSWMWKCGIWSCIFEFPTLNLETRRRLFIIFKENKTLLKAGGKFLS